MFIVQVIFFGAGEQGLERDVKKTAQCAVFSPRRDSNRVSGAKKGAKPPAPVGLRSKSHRPHQQKRR